MADETPTNDQPADWPTVEEARKKAALIVGDNSALDTLWQRILNGLIKAYAMRSASKRGVLGVATAKLDPLLVTVENWSQYAEYKPDYLWRGEATFLFRPSGPRGYGADVYVNCFDIRLDPVAVDREFPAPRPIIVAPSPPLPVSQTASPNRHAGGRPAEKYWDDLWAEIGRQLHARELVPRQQKDIEIAMTTWAENHGHHPAVCTIRLRAQKLARLLKIKVDN